MKSALVNFGVRSNSLSTSAKPESDGDVDEQRIAVGLGAGDELRADLAGGAGLGLDHEGCLRIGSSIRCERARHQLGGAARRERIDDGDGVGRIGVGANDGPDREGGGGSGTASDEAASVHAIPPGYWVVPILAHLIDAARGGRDQSRMAMARVQPAEAPRIFTGKQLTEKSLGRQHFEIVQFLDVAIADLAPGLDGLPRSGRRRRSPRISCACARMAHPSSSRRCR